MLRSIKKTAQLKAARLDYGLLSRLERSPNPLLRQTQSLLLRRCELAGGPGTKPILAFLLLFSLDTSSVLRLMLFPPLGELGRNELFPATRLFRLSGNLAQQASRQVEALFHLPDIIRILSIVAGHPTLLGFLVSVIKKIGKEQG